MSAQELGQTRFCRGAGCDSSDVDTEGWCDLCRPKETPADREKRRLRESASHPLTPMELVTLRCAASGHSAEKTAELLGKSVETIKTQRRYVIAKLKARNMTHAVAIALRRAVIN